MPGAGDLGLYPKTILDLPIENLALAVLQNYVASNSWNRYNWMLGAQTALGPGEHLVALEEAWSWLEVNGLVVHTPNQSAAEARILTRAGQRALAAGSLEEIRAAERIGLELHPLLQGKVRPIFLLGDYETAAFKAFKEVEVRVRKLAGLPNDLIGVALMRQAFNLAGGALTDSTQDKGEQQARSDLFAGAVGSFKNPTSHRAVTYSDPVEAADVVLLADLLMRILDGIESKDESMSGLAGPQEPPALPTG